MLGSLPSEGKRPSNAGPVAGILTRWPARLWSRRPSRSPDHAAEIAALECRVLVRKHVGLDVAECRVRLALDAVVEGLDDVLFEAFAARIRLPPRFSLGIAVLGIGEPKYTHLDPRRNQRDHGV